MALGKFLLSETIFRSERNSDFNAIHDLIVQVFKETFESGEEEARLIELLRQKPELGPNISYIAELDNEIVGHIFFSAVRL